MDVTTYTFVSRSITSNTNLNWVFLVDWLIVLFAAILFIFYFNRMFGRVTTWILCPILWKRYKFKINIQSLKISFLAGRIYFKNITVITRNELILIHQGIFTWRYWLNTAKRSHFFIQESNLNHKLNESLPSRYLLQIDGFEVFVYNKTGAYDAILKKLQKETEKGDDEIKIDNKEENNSEKYSSTESSLKNRKPVNDQSLPSKIASADTLLESTAGKSTSPTDLSENHEILDSTFLDFLPIAIEITQGSLIIGNETTPSLFVASYSSLKGNIDASLPGINLDYYRTNYDVVVSLLQVYLKPNVSYTGIEQLSKDLQKLNRTRKHHFYSNILSGVKHRFTVHKQPKKDTLETDDSPLDHKEHFFSESEGCPPQVEEWRGLERYLTSETMNSEYTRNSDSFEEFDPMQSPTAQYAKYTHILDSASCKINYYYDSPGLVPNIQSPTNPLDGPDIGNSDAAPKNGVDIAISGARIHYGPWADKEKGYIQQMMFPPICRNSTPFIPLKPGMRRQYTGFDLSIQMEDEAVLRMPHREESKDLSYMKAHITGLRPFGWLEYKVDAGSSVNIRTSFIPTEEKGFENTLKALLFKPELSTSVNHDLLFTADDQKIDAFIGYPLEWNSLADWKIDNELTNFEIYLLREHLALFSDLFSDFSSGAPTPYEMFRPFNYNLNFKFNNYAIYFDINEKNIINNPLDHVNNAYMSFKGLDLNLSVDIPIKTVYRKSSTIDYELTSSSFILSLEEPAWSTISNFIHTAAVGNANNFKISGSYTTYSSVEIDSVDTVTVDCTCDDTTLECYGFFIRYFLIFKENYFGDDMHFKNLSEFMEDFDSSSIHTAVIKRQAKSAEQKLKNETDLLFSFCVNNGCLILPCHIYDCKSHIALHFDSLDVDTRNNNYYMDLQANFSEVRCRYVEDCDESKIFQYTKSKVEFKPDMIIDDLAIHSVRIFGLPPSEPTYFCRWTFDTDGLIIDSEPKFLDAFAKSITSIKIGHKDLENSLGLPSVSVMDIVNLKFKSPYITIKLNGLDYLLQLDFNQVAFKLSDQGTTTYNSRLNLKISEVLIKCFKNEVQLLEIKTSIYFTNFCQKKNGYEKLLSQVEHLQANDGPYHRTPYLIPQFARNRKFYKKYHSIIPSIAIPDPPLPLTSESVDVIIKSFPEDVQRKIAQFNAENDENIEPDNDKYQTQSTSTKKDFDFFKTLDPNCEYDNFIINLDDLEIFICPSVAFVLVAILEKMSNFSIYFVLDNLQNEIFSFRLEEKSIVTKLKLEGSLVSLKIANSKDAEEYINFEILKPSLALCKSKIANESSNLELYLDINQFDLEVMKGQEHALLLILYHLTFKQYEEAPKMIIKFELDDLSLTLDPCQVIWMIDFVKNIGKDIEDVKMILETFKKNKQLSKIELLYAISTAGVDFNISHDPPCITKPSYVTRFCDDHIRLDNSWRIITRLRHVLNNLPDTWVQRKNAMFKATKWEAPKSAQDEVFNIFMNWRSWEFNRIEDSFILKTVFNLDTDLKSNLFKSVDTKIKNFGLNIQPFKDLFVLKNVQFTLNENKLADVVKLTTLPLLEESIEDGLDIGFRIESFGTNLTHMKNSIESLTSIVDDIYMAIDKMKKETSAFEDVELGSTASLNNVSLFEPAKPLLITLNFTLDEYRHSLGIDKSLFTVYGQGSSISSSIIKAEELLSFTTNLSNELLTSELLVEDIGIFEYRSDSHSTTIVSTGALTKGEKIISINNELVSFTIPVGTQKILKAIDIFVNNEYPILEPLIQCIKKTRSPASSLSTTPEPEPEPERESSTVSTEPFEDSIFHKIGCNFSLSINFDKIFVSADLLSPFIYTVEALDARFGIGLSLEGLIFNFNLTRLFSSLTSKDHNVVFEYFHGTIDHIKTLIGSNFKDDVYNVFVKIVVGFCRLNFLQNDFLDIVMKLKSDLPIANENLSQIKNKMSEIYGIVKGEEEKPGSDTLSVKKLDFDVHSGSNFDSKSMWDKLEELVRFHFFVSYGALSLVNIINGNQVVIECLRPKINLNTYDMILKRTKPHGTISIPSIKVILGLNGFHGNKFTVFDIQLEVRVKNPETADHKLQQLNITSNHCRIVLNSHCIQEFIETYGELSILFDMTKKKKKTNDDNFNNEVNLEKIQTILSFFSITIDAKNFCMGWLFTESDFENYKSGNIKPGIIIGFENTSIICTKYAGKLSMNGMYLSVAHGHTPSTFYSVESENNSDNRAFFPSFNLIYTIDSSNEDSKFKSKVNGDKVDFKFQTDIFEITEPLWASVMILQERFEYVKNVLKERKNEHTADDEDDEESGKLVRRTSIKALPMIVSSLSCIFKFDGASFYIHNSKLEINGDKPVLCLQAPTLSAVLKYVNNKSEAGKKKHSVSLTALTSKTDNRLLCSCVPVIDDIIRGCKRFMKKFNKLSGNNGVNTGPVKPRSPSFDFLSLFEKIDINFSLKIEPQKLELSCEPRANIEAEVALNDIHMHFNTDKDFLSGLIYVQSVKSELKHAYSKETSGSVLINDIIVNFTMSSINEKIKKFSTVIKIEDIDSYVNIQQRQDLDLFKDLWLTNESYKYKSFNLRKKGTDDKLRLNKDGKKTLSSMIKEVTSTSAFPWILSLIITKLSTKVDLGSSLGLLNIKVNNFLAISTKSMNWDHNLKLEFKKFSIESIGRLSGNVNINRIRLTTAISWKRDDVFLRIPLVLLSVNFENCESKILLDYHPFFIIEIKKFILTIFNQCDKDSNYKLKGSFFIESLKIFMTALTASNFVDIYTIGLRIRQEIKLSYRQVLSDAQLYSNREGESIEEFKEDIEEDIEEQEKQEQEQDQEQEQEKDQHPEDHEEDAADNENGLKNSETFLDMIEKFKTYLDIRIGKFEVNAFPSSLIDSQVLIIKIGKLKTMFYQDNSVSMIENKLVIKFDDIKVSLSSFKKKISTEFLKTSNTETDIKRYIKIIDESRVDDNLFFFPLLRIDMDTMQSKKSMNIINYRFKCHFGGKVDVRWKLGSVYFIKEMWYSHTTSLSNRLVALKILTSFEFGKEFEENYKESILESYNFEKKLSFFENNLKYQYVAVIEPLIETPQLKDLGNATPPLEWFGLHRNKLPNLTHQFLIIGIQKVVKEIEKNYSKVLN